MGGHSHEDGSNGHITPTRGIKQGDPLSLYLFLLSVDGLSSMPRKATETSHLHGITLCKGEVQISHLFFANDSLLFYEATPEKCHCLLDILAKYEGASGQAINRQKTSLFFRQNTRQEVKEEIQSILGAQIMTECKRYLGLPMAGGKSKVNTFKELQERVTKKVM